MFWNRLYDPAIVARDKKIKTALHEDGIDARSFGGALLFEPWELATGQSTPYKVFTPYWRQARSKLELRPARARAARDRFAARSRWNCDRYARAAAENPLGRWPAPRLDAGRGGRPRKPAHIPAQRDYRLSDAARFPGRARHVAPLAASAFWRDHADADRVGAPRSGAEARIGEAPAKAMRRIFASSAGATSRTICCITSPNRRARISIRSSTASRGRARRPRSSATGIAARPAFRSSTRVCANSGRRAGCTTACACSSRRSSRRICASTGSKARAGSGTRSSTPILRTTRRAGSGTAGTGADAAPYFRIFNPVTQGERFDPDGDYVRTWVRELRAYEGKSVHRPWDDPKNSPRAATPRRSPISRRRATRRSPHTPLANSVSGPYVRPE